MCEELITAFPNEQYNEYFKAIDEDSDHRMPEKEISVFWFNWC